MRTAPSKKAIILALVITAVITAIVSRFWLTSKSIVHWRAPDINRLAHDSSGDLIRYGRDLIEHTSTYLGPRGKVLHVSNGMNCSNCHIDAGTKIFQNCFSAVAAVYPVYRPRSGIVESIEFRINDCLQRSMNGSIIDSNSREMRAMVAYFHWLGKGIPKGTRPIGAGSEELAYMKRAADTNAGKNIYITKCQSCHGINGQGLYNVDSTGYVYPPLWGGQSYNTGAGLYRLSRFAGYVKNSMPLGANFQKPILKPEEAWDVAAYVNSRPRPVKNFSQDWPDIKKKAIDYPFGPYSDSFSESRHKYGPWREMKKGK